VLSALQSAVDAPKLSVQSLESAISACSRCPRSAEITTASALAADLLSALKAVDAVIQLPVLLRDSDVVQAQTVARKSHSQLLGGTSDDTTYTAKFQQEIESFANVCRKARSVKDECENLVENQQLLEKWTREQGIPCHSSR
jgi:hypothetical protein